MSPSCCHVLIVSWFLQDISNGTSKLVLIYAVESKIVKRCRHNFKNIRWKVKIQYKFERARGLLDIYAGYMSCGTYRVRARLTIYHYSLPCTVSVVCLAYSHTIGPWKRVEKLKQILKLSFCFSYLKDCIKEQSWTIR